MRKDLTGMKYGAWTVTGLNSVDERNAVFWDCVCDCGTERIVRGSSLTSASSISCGCNKKSGKESEPLISPVECLRKAGNTQDGVARYGKWTGVKGVFSKKGLFCVYIESGGGVYLVGKCSNLEDATAVRKAAEIRYLGAPDER